MTATSYRTRRGELEIYFDRTAVDAWKKLTSDAPVGRIRATVRAGRDTMRAQMLSWLPEDLSGRRILDAGCGTGAFSVELARRGAQVVAIDLSSKLVSMAQERLPADIRPGSIDFRVGDMLDSATGRFDHVVAMDSLIHYDTNDIVRALSALSARTTRSMVVTFAPRTPALTLMHAVGRLFPRGDRAPAIEPVSEKRLRAVMERDRGLTEWSVGRTYRVSRGFYISQGLEVRRDDI